MTKICSEASWKAIGAFERKLVTPGRRDAFLGGKKDAITAAEKKGFNVFFEAGCVICHSGPGVGGGSYQKLGAVKRGPTRRTRAGTRRRRRTRTS